MPAAFVTSLENQLDQFIEFGVTLISASPVGGAILAAGGLLAVHPVRFQAMDETTPTSRLMRRIIVSLTLQQLIPCGTAIIMAQAIFQGIVPPVMGIGIITLLAFGLLQSQHVASLMGADRAHHEDQGKPGYFASHPADRIGLNVVSAFPALAIGWITMSTIVSTIGR
jgi:hypothetical protein